MMRLLLILCLLLQCTGALAQLVTVPIPGAPGLSVTVATGTAAAPLVNLRNNAQAVNVTMADDANVNIPLGFVFPYWSQTFTTSWMHSNGVVSFQSPAVTGDFCCRGEDLARTNNPALNHAIMPLWTDLIAAQGSGRHYYLRENNQITYGWYNVNQYGTNNRSSFEVKLDSTGLVDVRLQGAVVTGVPVTSGMTGDLAQAQYFQFYHGNNFSVQSQQWSALLGTTPVDPCVTNPLSSPTCAGYTSAVLAQQCTVSALYDPTCPGYQQAYFTNQCSINPLYSELCPGYQEARYQQQCSINPLYDSGCTGYAQARVAQQLVSTATSATTVGPETTTTTVSTDTTTAAPSVSPAVVTTAVPLVTTTINTTSIAAAAAAAPSVPAASSATAPPQTRAQQLAQARAEAQRRAAAAQGTATQNAVRTATSMEQQIDAQNTVIAAMGHNAEFATYENLVLRDVGFYQSVQPYASSRTQDNARALRSLTGASEQRFEQMMQQQYR